MQVATAPDYLAAIKHLPPGTFFHADNVSWEVYERLLNALSETISVRVFYDQGRLEAMSPLGMHEKPAKVLQALITAIRYEFDIEIESYGQTTLRKQMKAKGAEPDDSFYIQHAAQVIGPRELDLTQDPPPDLVIESDLTSSSLNRFAIYAGLGVPEIWQIVNHEVVFWVLTKGVYQEAAASRSFPFLSSERLNDFVRIGLNQGQHRAARAFHQWMKKQNPPINSTPDA